MLKYCIVTGNTYVEKFELNWSSRSGRKKSDCDQQSNSIKRRRNQKCRLISKYRNSIKIIIIHKNFVAERSETLTFRPSMTHKIRSS